MTFYYFIIKSSYIVHFKHSCVSSLVSFKSWHIWGPCWDPSIHSLTPCLPQKPPEKWDIPCTRAQAAWRFHGSTDMVGDIQPISPAVEEGSKHPYLGGGNSNMLYFHPGSLGKMIMSNF